jgi:signal transduction histidine kinase
MEENGESLIVVRDNGEGITSENLQRIFDPFFTTKDVGEGMGLGLSICYRIMKQHGGRIQVESEPGAYAEFTLHFAQRPTDSLPA